MVTYMNYKSVVQTFLVSAFVILSGCSSELYRVRTNFFLLERGQPKESVVHWLASQKDVWKSDVKGGYPEYTKKFRHGSDVWEVWVFKVYEIHGNSLSGQYAVPLRYEHLAFRNDALEEWGEGELPLTIRQNPNQFELDINYQNRR